MINYEVFNELNKINATKEITAYLVNLVNQSERFTFLIPPQSLSISASNEYVEKNALFGKMPYVRYRHSKASRVNINDMTWIAPCENYDLSLLEAKLDSLRYAGSLQPKQPIDNIQSTYNWYQYDDSSEAENAPESIVNTQLIDPPQLSLVIGARVIQPLKLENYTITEQRLINGLPTNIKLNITFIALSNPIL